MANRILVDLLREGSEVWNLWRKEHSETDLDLSHANLSGANLADANLSSVFLNEALLSRANLSRANLSGANLNHATFSHATLYRTNFGSVSVWLMGITNLLEFA